MTFCVSAELIMDWVVVGAEVLSAIAAIVGVIIAGDWFLRSRQGKIGKSLTTYGIESIRNEDGTLCKKDKAILFSKNKNLVPTEVCLCFISGCNFIEAYQNKIKELAENGCKVKILLAKPNGFTAQCCDEDGRLFGRNLQRATDHYLDIIENKRCNDPDVTFQDREFIMLVLSKYANTTDLRKKIEEALRERGDHTGEVLRAKKILKDKRKLLTQPTNGDIILRYYIDEYRMPIIMAKYEEKKKKDVRIRVWTNLNAPIKEAKDSINVHAVDVEVKDDTCFAEDVEKSFDYLWETYSKPNGGNELF